MGLEINFCSDDGPRSNAVDCVSSRVDLFEAPDALIYQGACGGTYEGLEAAGFLPSFVKAYRERFGSSLQLIVTPDADKADGDSDDDVFYEKMMEHMAAGGCPADFLPEHLDIPVNAEEVADWTELWLRILSSEELNDPGPRQALLPYSHEVLEAIRGELQLLSQYVEQAKIGDRQLRMTAILD